MTQDVGLVLAAYLVGSIPMAYLVGRWVKGIDLRRYGSGNLGGSNVMEHVGKPWVVPTGGFDFLVKGIGMVALARFGLQEGVVVQGAVGLAAVAGHNWSVFLRFTGGRGVGVGLGALSLLSWHQLAAVAGAVVFGKFVFRATALAVLIGVWVAPVSSMLLGERVGVIAFCWGLAVLTVLKRLAANSGLPPRGPGWWRTAGNRVLYDRDVADRDRWVRGRPDG